MRDLSLASKRGCFEKVLGNGPRRFRNPLK